MLGRQAQLLAALAARLPTTVVVGVTGRADADAGVVRTLRRLGIDPPAELAPGPGGATAPPPLPVSPTATRILTASDADDEVRAAVRRVIDAVRGGTPARAHRHPVRLAPSLRPPAARAPRRRGHTPQRGRGPPARRQRARTHRPRPARAAGPRLPPRRRARPAGACRRRHGGRPHRRVGAPVPPARAWSPGGPTGTTSSPRWPSRTSARPGRSRAPATSVTRARRAYARLQAERAARLRTLVLAVIDGIGEARARPAPWAERVPWLRDLVDLVVGGDRALARVAGRRAQGRREDRRRARAAGRSRRHRRSGVARRVPPHAGARARRRHRPGRPLRRRRAGRARCRSPWASTSTWSSCWAWPRAPCRRRCATTPSSPTPTDATPAASSICAASASVATTVACWRRWPPPTATCSACPAATCGPAANGWRHAGWPRSPAPSRARRSRPIASPATPRRGSTACRRSPTPSPTARSRPPSRSTGCAPAVAAWPTTRAPSTVRPSSGPGAARPSPASTATSPASACRPRVDAVVSSTRLEGWARCPFAYFGQRLLEVQPVEDPAQQLEMSPLDRGSLIHEVLEMFVTDVLARPPSASRPPTSRGRTMTTPCIRRIAEQVCDQLRGPGADRAPGVLAPRPGPDRGPRQPVPARRRRQAARGRHPADRSRARLRLRRRRPRSRSASHDGRLLRFRGSADRIDAGPGGSLLVLDYKTGKADDYRSLSADNPDERGTKLQLAVYAQAARAHARPARGTGHRPSTGSCPSGAGSPARATRSTTRCWRTVTTTLGTIVDGIERGAFPAHPDRLVRPLRHLRLLRPRRHGRGRPAPRLGAQASRSGGRALRRPGRTLAEATAP